MNVSQLVAKYGFGIRVSRQGESFVVLSNNGCCFGKRKAQIVYRCRHDDGNEFDLCCRQFSDYEFVSIG